MFIVKELKTSLVLSLLFVFIFDNVFASDGLCGLEPPKEGGGCSGAKATTTTTTKQIEDKVLEKVLFDDIPENETEIWAKRFYAKMPYTTDLDWSIHELLDDAEEYIAREPETAIKKLNDILKKHPDSPRANYDIIRAYQFHYGAQPNLTEDQKLENSMEIVNKYFDLIMRYKPSEDVPEADESSSAEASLPASIFSSAVHQVLMECDSANLTKMGADILEKVFDLNPTYAQHERYHVILIEKYFILDEWESMETSIERARQSWPESYLLKFFHGLLLKKMDQKKEGNKMLREIEFEGEAATQFADEMRQLGQALYNRGKVAKALNLFMETSKVHGFLSQFQRPVITYPDLEAFPLWNMEDQVSLTKHSEEFSVLTENWKEIQADALTVAKNLSEAEGWIPHILSNDDQNLIVGAGNWSVYPIFAYGKSKALNCFKVSKTCRLIKEHFPTAARFAMGTIKLEVLTARTRVLPHCGPINTRLRFLLPLKVPAENFTYRVGKNTKVPFVEGQYAVIDDSFEHEMKNESDEDTIWLSIDFPHPDLPYEQATKSRMSDYAKRFFISY